MLPRGLKTAQRLYQRDGMMYPDPSAFSSPKSFLLESQHMLLDKPWTKDGAYWKFGIELKLPTIPPSNPHRRMFMANARVIQEILRHFFKA